MDRKHGGANKVRNEDAELSRRRFLVDAAMSAGAVSTLGFPVVAKAASAAAAPAEGAGVVAQLAHEEALTFGKNRYMGAPVTMAKGPNGAITIKELLSRIGDLNHLEPAIENPAKGIYVLGGYSLAPMAFIETDAGLIAFDTGDTKHDGELNHQAIRTITKKPFKAIIYGHSHTCYGAAVLAEGNKEIMVIGHPGLNDVVKANAGGAPAYFPEVGPYLTARAVVQFNGYMPKEGPDAYVVPTNLGEMDTSAFIPVNRPVQDGEEVTVLGVRMQFFTKYGSDDKVHTTVWLPDRKILFTTMLWSAPPQLYSLRGDVFRDPRVWIEGLKFNRDLNAEVLISAACRPIVGAKKIRQILEEYLDGASFVLDQSLRRSRSCYPMARFQLSRARSTTRPWVGTTTMTPT